jgi:hypothetical protein
MNARRTFGAIVVVVCSGMALGAAELAARIVDGYRLTSLRLEPVDGRHPRAEPKLRLASKKWVGESDALPFVRDMPVAGGVDRDWFASPLPERHLVEPDPELAARMARYKGGADERANYEWNWQEVLAAVCRGEHADSSGILRQFADFFVFTPTDGSSEPPFRYLQHAAYTSGLKTNAFGWRGPEIPLTKSSGTIRIAFVGASSTGGPHGEPYAYPELVGLWLNRWASARHPGISFEIINAARDGVHSHSLPAVVRQELLPMEPDLVYYDYDGGNQFWPGDFVMTTLSPRPRQTATESADGLLRCCSVVARRLARVLRGAIDSGAEPVKPPLDVQWPRDLDERDPDLAYPHLPLQLPQLLSDMDTAQREVADQGGVIAFASIASLVYPGMVLDPVGDRPTLTLLNTGYWPFTYGHIRRYLDFRTRVLRKYAAAHGLDFVDESSLFPRDARLFTDLVHLTRAGIHLQAWIVFNGIVPIIEPRLASREWPRPASRSLSAHPAFPGQRRLVSIATVRDACGATNH